MNLGVEVITVYLQTQSAMFSQLWQACGKLTIGNMCKLFGKIANARAFTIKSEKVFPLVNKVISQLALK